MRYFRCAIVEAGKPKHFDTLEPRKAWEIFEGDSFFGRLELGTRLSNRIMIADKKYGLIEVNDLVVPYEVDLTKSRRETYLKSRISQSEISNFKALAIQAPHSVLIGNPEISLLFEDASILFDFESQWVHSSAINVKVRNLINFFKIKNFDYRDLPAGRLRNPIGKPINHQQLKSDLQL